MNVRDVLKTLDADGGYLVVVRGSHRQFRHATKPERVTVAGHPSVDVPIGTLKNIWKQTGLRETDR